mmetsp:Transcript_33978/g.73403  ORF Transcript_33978/g.73403 Transcript_33978/m.73403 type:complete len:261 (+) Transcript_33978:3434-4216(+)
MRLCGYVRSITSLRAVLLLLPPPLLLLLLPKLLLPLPLPLFLLISLLLPPPLPPRTPPASPLTTASTSTSTAPLSSTTTSSTTTIKLSLEDSPTSTKLRCSVRERLREPTLLRRATRSPSRTSRDRRKSNASCTELARRNRLTSFGPPGRVNLIVTTSPAKLLSGSGVRLARACSRSNFLAVAAEACSALSSSLCSSLRLTLRAATLASLSSSSFLCRSRSTLFSYSDSCSLFSISPLLSCVAMCLSNSPKGTMREHRSQ